MKTRLVLYVILLLAINTASAQRQDDNWCFGFGVGISFSGSTPTSYTSKMRSIETSATVSDRTTGDLLFYTDGHTIWDATHTIMQNGGRVGTDSPTHSATQGAVIVPMPGNEDQYYVFCLSVLRPDAGYLYYSIVDVSLNGGRGGVLPSSKRVLLDSNFTESMRVVPGCRCVWLITKRRDNEGFYTYKITGDGISNTPVISPANHPTDHTAQSVIVSSPDHSTLALLGNIWSMKGGHYIALCDFDNTTGRISNTRMIDTGYKEEYNACEFSPDGTKLYISAGWDGFLQYDLNQPTMQDIKNSRKELYKLEYVTGVQLGPDGELYACRYSTTSIDRVDAPNTLSPVYNQKAVMLSNRSTTYRFPQKVIYPLPYNETITKHSTQPLCSGSSLTLRPDKAGLSYHWQDGSTDEEYTISKGGTYWVMTETAEDCGVTIDTFIVEDVYLEVDVNNDTLICSGDSVQLQAYNLPDGATYTWSTGTSDKDITVQEEGRYTFTASYKGCYDTAEVSITHYPLSSIELGADRELCKGDKLLLPEAHTTSEYDTYTWQDGSSADSLVVKGEGWYNVRVENACQLITDSVFITERNCRFFFPTVFTPNGDGTNDKIKLLGDVGALESYSLQIFSRWGERVFMSDNVTEAWDGNYKGVRAEIGTYVYLVRFRYMGEEDIMKGTLQLIR